jgi:para-nitrobenzyl esterase
VALNASIYGASCYSSTASDEPYFTSPSEDCLFLNVWTGATLATKKLPVMVFILGGGFQFGSFAQPTYDGSNLAKDGVVLVTINYRRRVFGFLDRYELDLEGASSGIYDLHDETAALVWVQQNIASFGGDPEQVTSFGESAGARTAGMLMTSTLTSGKWCLLDRGADPIATYQQAREEELYLRHPLSTHPSLSSMPCQLLQSTLLRSGCQL